MALKLYGFKYSVYAWIARFALYQKGVGYEWVEVNPFAAGVPADYLKMHPFQRVPAIVHDDFELYETRAILQYVDQAFEGPKLGGTNPTAIGRIEQIISIVDSYGYWPLVRQVFGNGVFNPRFGLPIDADAYERGLSAAPRVLDALDCLLTEDSYLVAPTITLADIHLAPMLSYFVESEEGLKLLQTRARLALWWSHISREKGFVETKPVLPASSE